MRRASLVRGGLIPALGLVSLVEALRIKDAWQGPRIVPAALGIELKRHLPLATRMDICT